MEFKSPRLLCFIGFLLIANLPINSEAQRRHFRNQAPPGTELIRTRPEEQKGEINPELYPWKHHIDFNEKHPGEDQIAVESDRYETRVRPPADFNPFGGFDDGSHMEGGGGGGFEPETDIQVFSVEHDMYSPPDLGHFMTGSFHQNPWPWPFIQRIRPWWKGPNVCIKREEEGENKNSTVSSGEIESNLNGSTSPITTTQRAGSKREHPGLQMRFSSCSDLDTKYTCETALMGPHIKRKVMTEFECCEGYKINRQMRECERGQFKNLADTIDAIGGSEFIRLAKMVGLEDKLLNQKMTVFVPNDEAMDTFMTSFKAKTDMENSIEREKLRRFNTIRYRRDSEGATEVNQIPQDEEEGGDKDWRNNVLDEQEKWKSASESFDAERNNELQRTLLSHMISGKMSTDDFVDEKVIYSENDNSSIRLNTWEIEGERVKTVNCARLVSLNHVCTNGMVHLTDRMFTPVSQTLDEYLTSNPELSTIQSLFNSSKFWGQRFKNADEHLTVFAPTNSALEKLDPSLLNKIKNGDPCLERILRHHIVPHTLCSSVIFREAHVRNLNHIPMRLVRNSVDELFINGSQIVIRDIITRNGIVHVIDDVLISEDDKPMTSVLENLGLTSFVETLTRLGMKDELDSMSNLTLFAPNNQAMDAIPNEIKSDPEKLRDILMYHVTEAETRACDFSDDQMMATRSQKPLRINLYPTFPIGEVRTEITAQCARVIGVNHESCGGLIHVVDRVLIPSDQGIRETLKTQEDFSIFTQLIQESNLTLDDADETFTLFVPTNSAFYALPRTELEKLLNDRKEAQNFLKRHIVRGGNLCCTGIGPQLWFLSKMAITMSGHHVPIYRDNMGQVNFGNVKVISCDLTASNGVIHTIDKVIKNGGGRRRYRRAVQIDSLPKSLKLETEKLLE